MSLPANGNALCVPHIFTFQMVLFAPGRASCQEQLVCSTRMHPACAALQLSFTDAPCAPYPCTAPSAAQVAVGDFRDVLGPCRAGGRGVISMLWSWRGQCRTWALARSCSTALTWTAGASIWLSWPAVVKRMQLGGFDMADNHGTMLGRSEGMPCQCVCFARHGRSLLSYPLSTITIMWLMHCGHLQMHSRQMWAGRDVMQPMTAGVLCLQGHRL